MTTNIVSNTYRRWIYMLHRAALLTVGLVVMPVWLAAASPPTLTILQPQAGAAAVSELESVIVEVQDDEPLPELSVRYFLNGLRPLKGFVALSSSDEGRQLRVELAFALMFNQDYLFEAIATDAEGLTSSARIYFDTFDPNRIVIEAEDYNYQSGRFIDSPNLTPEGMTDQYAYWGRPGVEGVDYHDLSSEPVSANTYRPEDTVGLQRTSDFSRQWFQQWGGAEAGIYDYSVGDVRAGEWLDYTRTFGSQAFKVRLRQRVDELSATMLEQAVVRETVRSLVPLGVFLNTPNDGWYRTVPLTDAVGVNEVVFRPSDVATVRLRQLTEPTGDGVLHNFLVFIPVEDPGGLGPLIAEVRPWPGETVAAEAHEIRAVIVNRETTVNGSSLVLKLNGVELESTAEPTELGATVSSMAADLVPGTTNRVEVSLRDSVGTLVTEGWSYAISADGVPQVESASAVNGPYAWVPAVVDLELQTVRVSVPVQRQFYRLRLTGGDQPEPLRIESIRMEADELVMSYGW